MKGDRIMKIQIIYSSLSGKTRRLAEYLFSHLSQQEKSIHDLKDGPVVIDGDIVLLGYWVDKGGPTKEMQELINGLKDKAVGIFCTLAYYADSSHAANSVRAGVELAAKNNTVIGSYVCNGALSESMIASFRKNGNSGPHSASPENEIRWAAMKNHPTENEMKLAVERFEERIAIYQKYCEQGLTFRSVL